MQRVDPARVRRFLKQLRRTERQRAQLYEVLEILGHLLHQGFPLQTALSYLVEAEPQQASSELVTVLSAEVASGHTLSGVLEPRLPPLYAVVLRAGEASGQLWRALELCTEHRKSAQMKRDQLLHTASYPALLLVALAVLICTLSLVLVPTYRTMYATLGLPLPLESATVFFVLERTPEAALVLILCGVTVICVLFVLRRLAPRVWQVLAPKLPFQTLLWTARTQQLCKLLFLLVDSGVPMADAYLSLAQQGPRWLKERMYQASQQVLDGAPLSASLGSEWHPLVRTSLKLSEGTGDLRWCFKQTAAQLETELERTFRRRVRRLEPVLLLTVGSLIAGVMLAVFVPMYNLAANISEGQMQTGGGTSAQAAAR